ncbi:BamA/TamA family outer membrane protein [Spirosoma taeanense]|uniref:BamA/TamA family outer membrane protein n=1 Tax=Spirosoma taeanense TaxID=2735870 RepID=A0A6M5YDA0_9BACT|nr:BamA/TamA family outer membrane protein [Spirosoma taeanense]QJW90942.1 BamA/TamA family outer membrane protein [Spirosoma taeanense]
MVAKCRLIAALVFLGSLFLVQNALATEPVDSTRSVVVRSVTLTGNYRTRDRIILREMTLHTGDTVRLGDLPGRTAWDQRNINNTNLFVTVDLLTQVTASADTTQLAQLDLTVAMKERWYLIAYPVFDLADRNFNEWWYDRGRDLRRTIYGGRLSYRNVTGNNDRLQLVLERGFLSRTIVSYSRPYIDRAQKIGMRVDFGYQTNKEIPYRTRADKWVYARSEALLRERMYAGLTLTHRRGLYHYHSFDARYTRNTIADTIARLNPDYFLDGRTRQQYLAIGYGYRYDRRDNVVYPLQGVLFSAGIGVSGLLPSDSFRFAEVASSATRYWSLGGRFYAATGLRGRLTWPSRQPYFNLRGLGSSLDMVRGYELFVVDGQRTTVWRNSLRYQLFNVRKQLDWLRIRQFNTLPIAAYLTAFGDAGYVSSTVAEQYQSRLANRLLVGTGMSLDIVTYYNLVFRFSGTINGQGKTGFFFNLAQEL